MRSVTAAVDADVLFGRGRFSRAWFPGRLAGGPVHRRGDGREPDRLLDEGWFRIPGASSGASVLVLTVGERGERPQLWQHDAGTVHRSDPDRRPVFAGTSHGGRCCHLHCWSPAPSRRRGATAFT
jgi:hypothetical protein